MLTVKLVACVILHFRSEYDVHYRMRLVDLSEVPALLARVFRASQLAILDPDAALGSIATDQDPPEMTLWVRAIRTGLCPVVWNPSLASQLSTLAPDDPICRAMRQFVGLS